MKTYHAFIVITKRIMDRKRNRFILCNLNREQKNKERRYIFNKTGARARWSLDAWSRLGTKIKL